MVDVEVEKLQEFQVVLFYRYTILDEVFQDALVEKLKFRCESLGILGRILIASEGLVI